MLSRIRTASRAVSYTHLDVYKRQLKDTDFVQKVKQLLIRYGVHPSLMEFELTETMLAESMEEAAAVIRGLRALGCKVSIDAVSYTHLDVYKRQCWCCAAVRRIGTAWLRRDVLQPAPKAAGIR